MDEITNNNNTTGLGKLGGNNQSKPAPTVNPDAAQKVAKVTLDPTKTAATINSAIDIIQQITTFSKKANDLDKNTVSAEAVQTVTSAVDASKSIITQLTSLATHTRKKLTDEGAPDMDSILKSVTDTSEKTKSIITAVVGLYSKVSKSLVIEVDGQKQNIDNAAGYMEAAKAEIDTLANNIRDTIKSAVSLHTKAANALFGAEETIIYGKERDEDGKKIAIGSMSAEEISKQTENLIDSTTGIVSTVVSLRGKIVNSLANSGFVNLEKTMSDAQKRDATQSALMQSITKIKDDKGKDTSPLVVTVGQLVSSTTGIISKITNLYKTVHDSLYKAPEGKLSLAQMIDAMGVDPEASKTMSKTDAQIATMGKLLDGSVAFASLAIKTAVSLAKDVNKQFADNSELQPLFNQLATAGPDDKIADIAKKSPLMNFVVGAAAMTKESVKQAVILAKDINKQFTENAELQPLFTELSDLGPDEQAKQVAQKSSLMKLVIGAFSLTRESVKQAVTLTRDINKVFNENTQLQPLFEELSSLDPEGQAKQVAQKSSIMKLVAGAFALTKEAVKSAVILTRDINKVFNENAQLQPLFEQLSDVPADSSAANVAKKSQILNLVNGAFTLTKETVKAAVNVAKEVNNQFTTNAELQPLFKELSDIPEDSNAATVAKKSHIMALINGATTMAKEAIKSTIGLAKQAASIQSSMQTNLQNIQASAKAKNDSLRTKMTNGGSWEKLSEATKENIKNHLDAADAAIDQNIQKALDFVSDKDKNQGESKLFVGDTLLDNMFKTASAVFENIKKLQSLAAGIVATGWFDEDQPKNVLPTPDKTTAKNARAIVLDALQVVGAAAALSTKAKELGYGAKKVPAKEGEASAETQIVENKLTIAIRSISDVLALASHALSLNDNLDSLFKGKKLGVDEDFLNNIKLTTDTSGSIIRYALDLNKKVALAMDMYESPADVSKQAERFKEIVDKTPTGDLAGIATMYMDGGPVDMINALGKKEGINDKAANSVTVTAEQVYGEDGVISNIVEQQQNAKFKPANALEDVKQSCANASAIIDAIIKTSEVVGAKDKNGKSLNFKKMRKNFQKAMKFIYEEIFADVLSFAGGKANKNEEDSMRFMAANAIYISKILETTTKTIDLVNNIDTKNLKKAQAKSKMSLNSLNSCITDIKAMRDLFVEMSPTFEVLTGQSKGATEQAIDASSNAEQAIAAAESVGTIEEKKDDVKVKATEIALPDMIKETVGNLQKVIKSINGVSFKSIIQALAISKQLAASVQKLSVTYSEIRDSMLLFNEGMQNSEINDTNKASVNAGVSLIAAINNAFAPLMTIKLEELDNHEKKLQRMKEILTNNINALVLVDVLDADLVKQKTTSLGAIKNLIAKLGEIITSIDISVKALVLGIPRLWLMQKATYIIMEKMFPVLTQYKINKGQIKGVVAAMAGLVSIANSVREILDILRKVKVNAKANKGIENFRKVVLKLAETITELAQNKKMKQAEKNIKTLKAVIGAMPMLIIELILITPLLLMFLLVSPIILLAFWGAFKIINIIAHIASKAADPKLVLNISKIIIVIGLLGLVALEMILLGMIAGIAIKATLITLVFMGVVTLLVIAMAMFGFILQFATPFLMAFLIGVGALALTIAAIVLIAGMLWLLQNIKLDYEAIKTNVQDVIGASLLIIAGIFNTKVDVDENGNVKTSKYNSVWAMIGGGIGKLLGAIAGAVILVFTVISVFAILLIAGMLWILQHIDLDPQKISENVGIILGTAQAIIEQIFSWTDGTDNKKQKEESWFGYLVRKIDSGLVILIEAILAAAILVTTVLVVGLLIVLAGMLMIITNIDLNQSDVKTKVQNILDTARMVIDMLLGSMENKIEKNDNWLVTAVKWLGNTFIGKFIRGITTIIDLIMVIGVLTMTIIAVGVLALLAGSLKIIANFEVDKGTIKQKVSDILETAKYVMGILREPAPETKEQNKKEEEKGLFESACDWLKDKVEGIGKAARFLGNMGFIATAIAATGTISKLGDILQSINNMKQIPTGAEEGSIDEKIKSLILTAKTVIDSLNTKDISSANMSRLIQNVKKLNTLQENLTTVVNLGKQLSELTAVEINEEKVVANVGTIVSAFDKINDSIKIDSKKLLFNMGAVKSLGEIVTLYANVKDKQVKNAEQLTEQQIKFIDKINGADLEKLRTTVNLIKQLNKLSESIRGNFEGLADALNEKIAPLLEDLKAAMEGVGSKVESSSNETQKTIIQNANGAAGLTNDAIKRNSQIMGGKTHAKSEQEQIAARHKEQKQKQEILSIMNEIYDILEGAGSHSRGVKVHN